MEPKKTLRYVVMWDEGYDLPEIAGLFKTRKKAVKFKRKLVNQNRALPRDLSILPLADPANWLPQKEG